MSPAAEQAPGSPPPASTTSRRRSRAGTGSSLAHSVRSAAESVLDKDLPPGFIAAAAEATAQAPTVGEIRSGGVNPRSGSADGHDRRRSHSVGKNRRSRRESRGSRDAERAGREDSDPFPALNEEDSTSREESVSQEPAVLPGDDISTRPLKGTDTSEKFENDSAPNHKPGEYANGYTPPPKLPWTTSTAIALKSFWKFFLTPFGFLVTIYGLNIVAWGGMLFLLLLNAAPAMCWANDPEEGWVYNCDHIDSSRRIWVEVTSQILNALFCVTGLGLIPWRSRDLYFILSYRFTSEQKHGSAKKMQGLRRLAGHYRTWYRLPGSDTLDHMEASAYAQTYVRNEQTGLASSDGQELEDAADLRTTLPTSKQPDAPPTGIRAPPTKVWKMDFFVWCQMWNTFFQICLCGFMWGMNRYDRPPWSTGMFVGLACGIVMVGGLVSYFEGKRVKKVEGVPPRVVEGG